MCLYPGSERNLPAGKLDAQPLPPKSSASNLRLPGPRSAGATLAAQRLPAQPNRSTLRSPGPSSAGAIVATAQPLPNKSHARRFPPPGPTSAGATFSTSVPESTPPPLEQHLDMLAKQLGIDSKEDMLSKLQTLGEVVGNKKGGKYIDHMINEVQKRERAGAAPNSRPPR